MTTCFDLVVCRDKEKVRAVTTIILSRKHLAATTECLVGVVNGSSFNIFKIADEYTSLRT